jgi:hypothetical protein
MLVPAATAPLMHFARTPPVDIQSPERRGPATMWQVTFGLGLVRLKARIVSAHSSFPGQTVPRGRALAAPPP